MESYPARPRFSKGHGLPGRGKPRHMAGACRWALWPWFRRAGFWLGGFRRGGLLGAGTPGGRH
jgi:hypothetical protein